jgi:hypothetical protein
MKKLLRTLITIELVGMTLLTTTVALAGSTTAESIWSLQNALDRAIAEVPADKKVTGHRCVDFEVSGTTRYRCTVFWE